MPNSISFVVEGDSWHRLPDLMQAGKFPGMGDYDLSRALVVKGHEVRSSNTPIAEWGDTIKNMASEKEYMPVLRQHMPQIFLLCGGGNDLLGKGYFFKALKNFNKNLSASEYLGAKFFGRLDEVEGHYREILDDVRADKSLDGVKIVLHGYGYAKPRNFGQWLGIPLNWRLINYWEHQALREKIVEEMIDRLYAVLAKLALDYPEVFVADFRDIAITWHDELHPDVNGFNLVADKVIQTANLSLVQEADIPIV